MKVYYDKKMDQLVLVTWYPYSKIYIYATDILFEHRSRSPASFKSLVYVGDFYSGETWEME